MSGKDTIDYHDKCKADGPGKLVRMLTASRELSGGRWVRVGRNFCDGPEFAVQYESPDKETGKTVVLNFMLSKEAAIATAALILAHVADMSDAPDVHVSIAYEQQDGSKP